MKKTLLATLLLLAGAFPVAAQNLLTNPTFDANVSSWTLTDPASTLSWSSLDANASGTSGSGHVSHGAIFYSTGATQCLNGVGAILFDLKVKTFIPSGQMATGGSGTIGVDFYGSPDCTGALLDFTGAIQNANFDAWTPANRLAYPAPAGVSSALITLSVTKTTGQAFAFDIFFDDAFFGPAGTPVELESFEAE